jgi:predicted  nucleic acid-binding Zn-ribbon protein
MTIPSLPSIARLSVLGFLIALLAACDTPGGTIREIRANLEVFKKTPNMLTLEKLDASFDKIETQIRDLEEKGDTVQADLFRRQALTLRYEYRAIRREFIRWSEEQLKKDTPAAAE